MKEKTFYDLGLSTEALQAVEAMGYVTPTPIQEQTIPLVLAGKDVVGAAQTGTGKTAAFVLPMLDLLQAESKAAYLAWKERQAKIEERHGDAGESSNDADAALCHPERSEGSQATENESPEGLSLSNQSGEGGESQDDGDPVILGASKGALEALSDELPAAGGNRKKKRRRKKKKAYKKPKGPFGLVITPTRELAQQIDDVATQVGGFTKQRVLTVVGGKKYGPQIEGIARGIDVLVATPGRLIDLMNQDAVDLSKVRFLVLDEADRMLDMGFWPSVRKIVAAVPEERQTLLFSATLSKDIMNTTNLLLKEPEFVEIARKGETADTVEQHVMPVSQTQKGDLLISLLEQKGGTRILVFTRTKRRADICAKKLKRAGFSTDSIHSDKSQSTRQRILDNFKASKLDVLIATDVLARGIDINEVNYVVNFDVPQDPEDYVHRIGRTGRAGEAGVAYTFVAIDEIPTFREIEYFTHRVIDIYDLEGFEYTEDRIIPRADRSAERGVTAGGKRKMPFSSGRGGRGGRRSNIPRRR